MLLLVGYFCLLQPGNQLVLQWGTGSGISVLHRLAGVPFAYFCIPQLMQVGGGRSSKAVCLPASLSACLLHCLPACPTVCLPAALSACLPHCLPACRIVCTLYLSACVLPVCTRGVCLCSHHMASVNVFILSLPIARSLLQPSRARARDPRHAPPTLTCTHT